MSVSISLVCPSISMIAAGLPPGSSLVAHSARVRAVEAKVAIYATPSLNAGYSESVGAAFWATVVDHVGRRARRRRLHVAARPESVLLDHLAEPHERLHHRGMVAGAGEAERLAQARHVEPV